MNMKSAPANCPLTQKVIEFFTDKEILDSNSFMDNKEFARPIGLYMCPQKPSAMFQYLWVPPKD